MIRTLADGVDSICGSKSDLELLDKYNADL
jgi:hypothetical protein